MILALVGMSGIGKSHHAALLAARGVVHHDIDAAIAERIGDLCAPLPGERPVETVGRWMGMPWVEGRAEREAEYLALEAELTEAAIDAALGPGEHVIDTTGSVIYLPPATLDRLRARATVVHLVSRTDRLDALVERYLSEPKPVIWGEHWVPARTVSRREALEQCYAGLLAYREARYAAIAHRSVDAESITTDALLAS